MIQRLSTIKTKYVEVVDDGLHSLDKRKVAVLKETGKSFGIEYAVHAPFADLNIASASDRMRRFVLERLEKSIAHASALEASVWVFHPGIKTGISMFYPGMDWKRNCQCIRILQGIANEYGVRITIENVPEPYAFLMKSVEDFMKFYRETNLNVEIALDVGHSNLNRQTDQFLRTFSGKIGHIHVSDNMGINDQHLGIGRGNVCWERFAESLLEIAYEGVVVVESVEHVEKSLQKARELFH